MDNSTLQLENHMQLSSYEQKVHYCLHTINTAFAERQDKQLCESFQTPKTAFWSRNQPDRTRGRGFFTQIEVKLAQMCSEQ